MAEGRQWVYDQIGEPPQSPWGYAAEKGISEDQVPQEVFKRWRDWNTKEQALVEKAASSMSGQSTEEILTNLGYANEADKGKSMFARYTSGDKKNVLTDVAKDAFQTAVRGGHMTWDAKTGVYHNQGLAGNEDYGNWQYWDENGKPVNMPKGFYYDHGYGQQTAGVTADAPRPYLKTPAGQANQGAWGQTYSADGRMGVATNQASSTSSKPVEETAPQQTPESPSIAGTQSEEEKKKKLSLTGSSNTGLITGDMGGYGNAA